MRALDAERNYGLAQIRFIDRMNGMVDQMDALTEVAEIGRYLCLYYIVQALGAGR